MQPIDQRIHDRAAVRMHVTVMVQLVPGRIHAREMAYDETIDISESGIRFRDNGDVPDDTPLLVRIDLPDGTGSVDHEGRVCWRKPSATSRGEEVGIQFVHTSARDKALWEEFVRDQLGRQNSSNGGGGILKG